MIIWLCHMKWFGLCVSIACVLAPGLWKMVHSICNQKNLKDFVDLVSAKKNPNVFLEKNVDTICLALCFFSGNDKYI